MQGRAATYKAAGQVCVSGWATPQENLCCVGVRRGCTTAVQTRDIDDFERENDVSV